MNLTKVILGGFIAVSSLFGLVFVGGTFLLALPANPLRLGSAIVTEFGAPSVAVWIVVAVVLLMALAPVLLGVGIAAWGVLE